MNEPALQAQLARVLGNLDDDDELLVYADMLTESGHPRGEFIMLQLLSDPDAHQVARMHTLLEENIERWLGTLYDFADEGQVEFNRGFPTACSFRSYWVDHEHLRALSSIAGTLEILDLTDTDASDLTPLCALVKLKSLNLKYSEVVDVQPLSRLTALKDLNLDCTDVSDLSPLAGLINLETLSLEKTQVSDLEPLAGLCKLKELNLRSVLTVPVSQIETLRRSLPTLLLSR